MVDCLVVFSLFIHQPDAIETVHFTVVAHPESSSNLVYPGTACLAFHRNQGTGGNGTGNKYFFFGLLVNGNVNLCFFFIAGNPDYSR
jgi:hypothetical protein